MHRNFLPVKHMQLEGANDVFTSFELNLQTCYFLFLCFTAVLRIQNFLDFFPSSYEEGRKIRQRTQAANKEQNEVKGRYGQS